jgi:hypothetical protein
MSRRKNNHSQSPSPPIFPAGVAVSPVAGEEVHLLRALLQSTEEGVLMTTHDGQDVVCNRRFGELSGLDISETVRSTRDEVRRRVLDKLRHPEQFVALLEKIYSDPDLVWEDEVEMIAPQPRALRRRTRPVYNEQGENIGRLWTFHDITRVKRQQDMQQTLYQVSAFHDPDPAKVYNYIVEKISEFYGNVMAALTMWEGKSAGVFKVLVGEPDWAKDLKEIAFNDSY